MNTLVGDQHCFPILKQLFLRLGIFYREVAFGSGTRAALFGNLYQLIAQRKFALGDNPVLLEQLSALKEVTAANGNVDVRPPRCSKDDVAIAVALAASELSERFQNWHDPFILGGGQVTGVSKCDTLGYPVAETCEKFPGCFNPGCACDCYGC